jgi:hypothetical protein
VAGFHSEPTFSFTFLDQIQSRIPKLSQRPARNRLTDSTGRGICGLNIFCAGIRVQSYLPTGAWVSTPTPRVKGVAGMNANGLEAVGEWLTRL